MTSAIEAVLGAIRDGYGHLGSGAQGDGTELVGRARHLAPEAWLHVIFRPLTAAEVEELEAALARPVPQEYRALLERCNGLYLFSGSLSLDGLRTSHERTSGTRQPFPLDIPNVHERPAGAPDSAFFLGGYKKDGSLAYLDADTGAVCRCGRRSARPLNRWESLDGFLAAEFARLSAIHGQDGVLLPGAVTTPAPDR
jgi:hypothetical protein